MKSRRNSIAILKAQACAGLWSNFDFLKDTGTPAFNALLKNTQFARLPRSRLDVSQSLQTRSQRKPARRRGQHRFA